MKKLNKGTGKFKGKLPFKCFNSRKVGHFPNKCLYRKQEENDNEKNYKYHNKRKIGNKKKVHKNKKTLYTKEENNSSEESEGEEEESENLFMSLEKHDNPTKTTFGRDEYSEEEGEVDIQ